MPVVEVHLSALKFEQIGKENREALGNEWREAVHGIIGEPLENIAVFWQPFADAQNPLEGLELWVFFGIEGRESIALVKSALMAHFKRVIQKNSILPRDTEIGVWILPQPDSDFGSWKAGSDYDEGEGLARGLIKALDDQRAGRSPTFEEIAKELRLEREPPES